MDNLNLELILQIFDALERPCAYGEHVTLTGESHDTEIALIDDCEVIDNGLG